MLALLEFFVVISVVIVGVRLKGMGVGMLASFGLVIFVFFFRIYPGKPPLEVPIVILAMVLATSTLESAGGLDYIIGIAEKFLRKYPKLLTFISPFVAYITVFFVGTSHSIYSFLPIVSKIAKEVGIKPSKPLVLTVIASQQASLASPISPSILIAISILGPLGIGLSYILKICIPATFIATIITSIIVSKQDNDFDLLDTSSLDKVSECNTKLDKKKVLYARISTLLFTIGIIFIILLGSSIPNISPTWQINNLVYKIPMSNSIVIIMLATAGLTMLFCNIKAKEIFLSTSFISGFQAFISILGMSWLGRTFTEANKEIILSLVGFVVNKYPFLFSLVLFLMCILLMSQSVTLRLVLPIGIAVGLPITSVVASLVAANAVFVIPNYPTILAAINIDDTGSTKIGKYLFNHSFMLPGLIATGSATIISYLLTKVL